MMPVRELKEEERIEAEPKIRELEPSEQVEIGQPRIVGEDGEGGDDGGQSTLPQNFVLGALRGTVGLPGDIAQSIGQATERVTGIDFGQLDRGFANLLGVDPETLQSFAPTSRNIQAGLAPLEVVPEVGQERQDFLGRASRFAGAGFGGTGGLIRQGERILAKEASKTLPQAGRVTQGARELTKEAARRPKTALTGEATFATGAAGGGVAGERLSGGDESARAVGELLGGLGLVAAPSLLANTSVIGLLRKFGPNAVSAFRAKTKARQRISELTEDPAQARQDIRAGEGPTVGRTQEPGLRRLERTARERDIETDRDIQEQREALQGQIAREAREVAAEPRTIQPSPPTQEERVLRQAQQLQDESGRILIRDLRRQFPSLSQDDFDQVLLGAARRGDVSLQPLQGQQPSRDVLEEGLDPLGRDPADVTRRIFDEGQQDFPPNAVLRLSKEAEERLTTPGKPSGVRETAAPEEFRNFIERQTKAMVERLRRRVRDLKSDADAQQLAKISRDEVSKVYNQVNKRESQAFEALDLDANLVPTSARDELKTILQEEPAADQLPGFITKKLGKLREAQEGEQATGVLGPKGEQLTRETVTDVGLTKGSLGDDATFNEVKQLRTDIGKEIRAEARKAGDKRDQNKIRLLSRLDDALLEDMERLDSEGVQNAIAIARNKNRLFRQGTVGKILGFQGRQRPEETLESTLRGGPATRGANLREMLSAAEQADDPDLADRVRTNVREFLKQDFTVKATNEEGEIERKAAQRFLENNRDVLKEFPDLRRKLQDVRQRQKIVDQRLGRQKEEIDPITRQKAAASQFLNQDPIEAIDEVLSIARPQPGLKQLVEEAKEDPKGRAFKGLKSAFVENIIRRSQASRPTETGEFPIQGAQFVANTEELGDAAVKSGLLKQDEVERLKKIGTRLARQEAAEQARPLGELIEDRGVITNVLDTVTQVIGAATGRAFQTGTIQAPGKMASFLRNMKDRLTTGQAEKLLIRFVRDPEFAELMLSNLNQASPEKIRQIRQSLSKIIGASAGPLTERLQPEEEQ